MDIMINVDISYGQTNRLDVSIRDIGCLNEHFQMGRQYVYHQNQNVQSIILLILLIMYSCRHVRRRRKTLFWIGTIQTPSANGVYPKVESFYTDCCRTTADGKRITTTFPERHVRITLQKALRVEKCTTVYYKRIISRLPANSFPNIKDRAAHTIK